MQRMQWHEIPIGTKIECFDTNKKTVYFVLRTENGDIPCEPPEGYELAKGYRLIEVREDKRLFPQIRQILNFFRSHNAR